MVIGTSSMTYKNLTFMKQFNSYNEENAIKIITRTYNLLRIALAKYVIHWQ